MSGEGSQQTGTETQDPLAQFHNRGDQGQKDEGAKGDGEKGQGQPDDKKGSEGSEGSSKKSEGTEKKQEPGGLTEAQIAEYALKRNELGKSISSKESDLAKERKQDAAYRIALRDNTEVKFDEEIQKELEQVERDNDIQRRLDRAERKERRVSVVDALMSANLPKDAYELVARNAKFDEENELTNGEDIVRIAQEKIGKLTGGKPPTESSSEVRFTRSDDGTITSIPGNSDESSSSQVRFKPSPYEDW